MDSPIELIKNIAAVIGCISACIALLTTIIKPFRQRLIDTITYKSQSDTIAKDIKLLHAKLDDLKTDNTDIKDRLSKVEKNVLDNEADRIRAELFDCGNRCRRGIRLHPEEMEHLRTIFHKYKDVLKQNHEGDTEYNFICDYYNHQDFPKYHQENNLHNT